jgi:hypothetical protein
MRQSNTRSSGVDANSFLSLIHCVKSRLAICSPEWKQRRLADYLHVRRSSAFDLNSCWFQRSEAVQKKQMPFLEVPRRLAVRAVKAAVFAFMERSEQDKTLFSPSSVDSIVCVSQSSSCVPSRIMAVIENVVHAKQRKEVSKVFSWPMVCSTTPTTV